jgi:hypothetical protein
MLIVAKSPESTRLNPSSTSSRSVVARKPIAPKLTANTGTLVPA